MSKLQELKKHLKSGQVYRRSDLLKWSNAVDRHLKDLLQEGYLVKLSAGVYSRPKKTVFGDAPVDESKLVKAFLKDDDFLLTSANFFNALGVGTTQLANETVVYNRKRHGTYVLGGRNFRFRRMYRAYPTKLSQEYLMVDLMDNLVSLGEDVRELSVAIKKKAATMDKNALKRTAEKYGGVQAKRLFAQRA